MLSVFNLVLPFFGLIFLGFFVARINRQPLEALGWMNTFIVYVALPALFFQILSKTSVAELTQWSHRVNVLYLSGHVSRGLRTNPQD